MDRRIELAEAVAKAQSLVTQLMSINAYGATVEERVAMDARLRLARSALDKAQQDYSNAINGASASELLELAKSDGPSSQSPE